jgi:3'-5' exonuclease
MNRDTLTFDIETIPQRAPLTGIQQEEVEKRVSRHIKANPETSEEDAQSLIMGTSAYFGEVVCIGIKLNDDAFSLSHESEEVILSDWWKVLQDFQGLFISFNGLGFDSPFLLARSMKYGYLPTNKKFCNLYKFQADVHFDVYNIAKFGNFKGGPSLRLLCDHLGIPSPKEEEIKAENVAEAHHEGRIQEICDYCIRDVHATYRCYEQVKHYTSFRT